MIERLLLLQNVYSQPWPCIPTLQVNKCKKTVVYLQLITAKWHIENSKNNERWYYFSSTLPLSTCF